MTRIAHPASPLPPRTRALIQALRVDAMVLQMPAINALIAIIHEIEGGRA